MENIGFWAVAVGMAGMVAAILLMSLRQSVAGTSGTGAPASAATRLYRDQLAEVDRDVARGTLAEDEATRLRTEIARRMLDADRADKRLTAGPAGGTVPLVAAGLVLAVLAVSVFLYARWGAPGYPDLPLTERLALADRAMAERPDQATAVASAPPAPAPPQADAAFLDLMDKLRAALKARPNDVTGLALLARNEAALGNLPAAEEAQRRLIAARGDASTAEDHAGLAEVMIRAAGGYVSPEAEAELQKALALDPSDGAARYFSGLMFAQGGRYDRAFALWRALLDAGPADAPWIAPIRGQIPEVAARAGVNYTLPPEAAPGKGPDAADVAAAADMAPEDRQAMIEGMVAQLGERLATEGGPAEDWAKLIRALGVLGQKDRAGEIYAEARTRFEGDDAALSFLGEAALEAGLTP